jgi:hypothetical protein
LLFSIIMVYIIRLLRVAVCIEGRNFFPVTFVLALGYPFPLSFSPNHDLIYFSIEYNDIESLW